MCSRSIREDSHILYQVNPLPRHFNLLYDYFFISFLYPYVSHFVGLSVYLHVLFQYYSKLIKM
jgi:hypothetical protein